MEREKIDIEFKEIEILIKELREVFEDNNKIYDIMKKELLEFKEKYGDKRRIKIEEERMEIFLEDLIKDEEIIIIYINKGYVKRIEVSKYKV